MVFAVTTLAITVACSSSENGTTVSTADAGPSTSNDASGADAAIEDRGAPASGVFSFIAKAEQSLPPGAKVAVAWGVFDGSPDYSYVFGGGSTSGVDVYVSFSGEPPIEALNGPGKLGIGILFVVDASTTIAEGKQPSGGSDAGGTLLALTPGHAVIYRNTTEQVMKAGWDLAFPQGFACGACEDRDGTFDAFVKTDCANVKLVPYGDGGGIKFCNYT